MLCQRARAGSEESCMEMKLRLDGAKQAAGMPYCRAELKNAGLEEKLKTAAKRENGAFVWLTDEQDAVIRLKKEHKCVLYLLTQENAGGFCPEAEWCAEAPEGWPAEMESGGGKGRKEAEILSEWPDYKFLWQVWLRSHGLPWHICETKRLCLREAVEEDLDFFYEMMGDPEAAQFLDSLDQDREKEREKLAAYQKQMYGFYGFGIWTVLEKSTGRTIGRAGLQMREGFREPELGFGIGVGFREMGYGEEACRAVLDYAAGELELPCVRAVVDEKNVSSRRLCEKLGFYVDTVQKREGGMWIFYRYDCRI